MQSLCLHLGEVTPTSSTESSSKMYRKGKKLFSTPVNVDSGSTSFSLSDVNHSSPIDIHYKNIEPPKVQVEERKGKRKRPKFKDLVRKYRKKASIKSQDLNNEWQVESILDDNYNNEDEATLSPVLFKSPERTRDFRGEQDYVLSPPLIAPGVRNLSLIENEAVDKEEEVCFGENKMEIDDPLPIFERSKVGRVYTRAKRISEERKRRLLINKGKDWLINLKIPTFSADLLWENYIKDNNVEFPQSVINNDIEENDSSYEGNTKDSTINESSSDILSMVDKETRQLLKNKKLCRIKGSCNKNGITSTKVEEVVYVSDDKLPPELDTCDVKMRRGKLLVKRDVFDGISWKASDETCDTRQENGERIGFNKFHEICKRKKKNKDAGKSSRQESKVTIKSVEKLINTVVRKQSDGNFVIIRK